MRPAFPVGNRAASPEGTAPVRVTGAARPDATSRTEQNGRAAESASPTDGSRGQPNPQGLEPEELKELSELKARDREVRAHEAAHQAVGGQYAGAISYVYERGPDGAQYAVGGEVSIDTSPVNGDPQATIEKMRTVRAAALAPAEPSPQDRAVAAQAMQLMLQAQAELATESGARASESSATSGDGNGSRRSQDASQAYQSVGELGAINPSDRPSSPFQATA